MSMKRRVGTSLRLDGTQPFQNLVCRTIGGEIGPAIANDRRGRLTDSGFVHRSSPSADGKYISARTANDFSRSVRH
jgi:hypothetical protein